MGLAGIAAAVGAAATVGSAISQSSAAGDAADAQTQAAQDAQQTQLHMYNQTRQDLSPYLNMGNSALRSLGGLFGLDHGQNGMSDATANRAISELQRYPGYQFQFNQGQQALDRSAASRGLLLSGAQVKDSQQFGQGMAQGAWGDYLNRLFGLAGIGENAGAQVGNAGTTAGQGIASSQLAAGQAQAAGAIGSANALTTGLQGGLNSALTAYQLSGQNDLSGNVSYSPYGGSALSVMPTTAYNGPVSVPTF